MCEWFLTQLKTRNILLLYILFPTFCVISIGRNESKSKIRKCWQCWLKLFSSHSHWDEWDCQKEETPTTILLCSFQSSFTENHYLATNNEKSLLMTPMIRVVILSNEYILIVTQRWLPINKVYSIERWPTFILMHCNLGSLRIKTLGKMSPNSF